MKGFTDGYAKGKRDAMEWISVKERLPESVDKHLVVTDGGNIYIAVFTGSRWYLSFNGNFIRDRAVTHWMPLPELPEVEG